MNNQEILDLVIQAQQGFVYEKKVDVDSYLIYHCHKPGTRVYSFELVFGREGIYVNGDVDSIVWEHRTGLDFLAGEDVDYYIYSKLGSIYRGKQVVDEEKVNRFLAETMVIWLLHEWENEESVEIPWEAGDAPDIKTIIDFYKNNQLNDEIKCEAWGLYNELRGEIWHDDLRGIYEIACAYDPDASEYGFGKPAWSVMFCMYMACYAARKIKEQEDAGT